MSRELIDLAVERLREDFPSKSRSWVRRALIRFMRGTVREFNENTWVVRGLPELGDRYPTYVVRLRDGRYYCSCFESSWGLRRKSEICTHIAAVILYRNYRKLDSDVYASVINIECVDYYLEIPSELKGKVRIVKSIRVIDSTDRLNPRHRVTYVIYSSEPMEINTKLVCDGDVRELSLKLTRTRRYMIELLTRDSPF
jgi:SWIM zinc finger.